jgi:myo-inositol 2-dehydrogenase/D-chiro-inositol 1-dehydrogenase
MKLRTVVIGAGRIGSLHAKNVSRHPRLELAAIHDVDERRARALADRYHTKAYPDLGEALAAADVAVVASSTDSHAAAALAAADAGKPMYLEKPIDLDLHVALRTASALHARGVPVMLGFNRRFDNQYRELFRDVRNGALGRVQIVRITSRGPNDAPSPEYITHSGGIYRDKTVHFLDLLRFFTGREIETVYAMGATHVDNFIGELGDVDTCVVQLRLDDGSFCQIDNTRRAVYGFDERIEVLGTKGLREVGRSAQAAVYADERGIVGFPLTSGFMERFEVAFGVAMDGFVRLVLDGDRDVPSLDDGIAAQLAAEAATVSAREGRPIQLGEITEAARVDSQARG